MSGTLLEGALWRDNVMVKQPFTHLKRNIEANRAHRFQWWTEDKEASNFLSGRPFEKKKLVFFKILFPPPPRYCWILSNIGTDQTKRTCLMMCSSMNEVHSRISNPSSKAATAKFKIRHKKNSGSNQREGKDPMIPTVLDPQQLLKFLIGFRLHYWLTGTDVCKRYQTLRNTHLASHPEWRAVRLTQAEQPMLLL